MGTLTVLTYNVHHAALDENAPSWERRQAGVLERLRQPEPDLICLQECAGQQHDDVAAALPDYEWVGVADTPGSGEHNPIGYRRDLQLLDTETVWLSESGAPGSVGWDGGYPRVMTAAQFRDPATDSRVALFNTHFDHLGERARLESATRLRQLVDALPADRKAVAAGDFNAAPGTEPYERLVGEGFERPLVDARAVAAETTGPETTFTDFETTQAERELDHVLLTPELTVDSYTVDTTSVNGQFPSDHLPVIVEFTH